MYQILYKVLWDLQFYWILKKKMKIASFVQYQLIYNFVKIIEMAYWNIQNHLMK